MSKYFVLFNPYSGNHHGEEYAHKLDELMPNDELEYFSMPEVRNFKKLFKGVKHDIIVCGGDGTLNYFVNRTRDIDYKNNVLYYETGTGNDFHNDIGNCVKIPYHINDYIKDLPVATINNQEYAFINNVGMGLDGYCCEVGEERKREKNIAINYTSIALKGLSYDYKPCNAKVWIDGVYHEYKKVWLATTMNGRFYGGGMMMAPDQFRLNKEHKVTFIILSDVNRLETLLTFPKIFKGNHLKNKHFDVYEGKEIKVVFDRPSAINFDGEVIINVKEYTVKTKEL